MKVLSILLSLAVSEKIECYQCTYLWYEVDGVSHGVTGDSTCRDGQADKITLKKAEKYGEEEQGQKWQTKCVSTHMTGNETVYLNDGKTQQIEVNLYVRRPYIVWEESNLYKYNGPLSMIENQMICGMNRTECSGDLRPRLAEPECKVPNECPCPRCSWVQIRNDTADGGYTSIAGDATCESGDFDILPDKDACVAYQAGPSYSEPLKGAPNLFSIPHQNLRDGAVGGSCSIIQELVTMPGNDTVEEMINLFRDCYSDEILPMNFYSDQVMKSQTFDICDEDKCNISSGRQSLTFVLLFLIFSLM